MPYNKKFVYIRFTFVAVLLIAIALYNRSKPIHQTTPESYPATTTIYDVKAIELNENGEQQRQLEAPKLIHHIKSSQKVLKKPVIHIKRDKTPWVITADQATSNHDDSKIILIGHVHIVQFQNKLKISELLTSRLNYYPNSQKVDTNQNITYLSQGMTVHSKGLRADLHQETMELVSNARGVYVPKKKNKKS